MVKAVEKQAVTGTSRVSALRRWLPAMCVLALIAVAYAAGLHKQLTIETLVLAERMDAWCDELAANIGQGDLRIADNEKWDPSTWPKQASGAGFHEAPRGALGHWVRIEDGAIANYQCVVPNTWNAGPRDAAGKGGPYEAALEGTPVADPEKPLEILRTVHSFDPCMACGVHVVDTAGRELTRVRVA